MDENTPPPAPGKWQDVWKEKIKAAATQGRERIKTAATYASDRARNFYQQQVAPRFTPEFRQSLLNRLRDGSLEPAVLLEHANRFFQKQGADLYVPLTAIFLCSYFVSDLTSLLVGKFIPEPPAVITSSRGFGAKRARSLDDYGVIFTRKLLPVLDEGDKNPGPALGSCANCPAVKTTLPFNLVGTMILDDELHSIATIEDKTAAAVYPVRVQDEITSKAKILKIEPKRVTFLNIVSGQREFVEMPDEPATSARVSVNPKSKGIEQVAGNQFSIARGEVDKTLSDLNRVLTEARAVPNMENGVANGYKLFQIVPGSIYDKLGLKDNDVISGLNGEPINDPGKAFQMLSELKTANHMELAVKRDGQIQNFVYDIHP